jgi:hypothetical protein
MRRNARKRLLTLATSLMMLFGAQAGFGALVSPASAGTFVLSTCPGDDGWSQGTPTASWISYSDGCTNGGVGSIAMAMGPTQGGQSTYAPNSSGGFALTVPSPYTITKYTMALTAFGGPCTEQSNQCTSGEGDVTIENSSESDPVYDFRDLGAGAEIDNLDVNGLTNVTGVAIGVSCDPGQANAACPGNQSGGPEASVSVSSADFWLNSDATPAADNFTGTLLGGSAQGTASLVFEASDPGGPGVYNVQVLIGGTVVYSGTPNTNGGLCVPSGSSGGALIFDSFQPCQEFESVDLPINTAGLATGSHELRVVLTDAAGDSTTVFDRTITVGSTVTSITPSQFSLPSTTATYAFAPGSQPSLGSSVVRTYRGSALTLSGRLTSASGATPAPGVTLALWSEPAHNSGTFTELATTTSGSTGLWSLRAPKGASRLLRVVAGSGQPTASLNTLSVNETVTPSLSLKVSAGSDEALSFSGRLQISPIGSPLPHVFFEIKGPDGWQPIGSSVRVASNGDFRYLYTSSPATRGQRFAFRVVAAASTLWPSAASAAVSVRVR